MGFAAASEHAVEELEAVYLYTYHNKPPFVVNLKERKGLFYDLADYLSARDVKNDYQTVYIPRKRLDRMIESESLDGVVIGVSPEWFSDAGKTQYYWFSGIYPDKDEFVSLKAKPFEYAGLKSFDQKVVAGVAGYYYFGINEAVSRKHLKRVDTIGERQVLELIAKGRADFGIVSQSVFKYLKSVSNLPDIYHLSERPHDVFTRSAFTLKNKGSQLKTLQVLLKNLQQDPQWKQILSQYE